MDGSHAIGVLSLSPELGGFSSAIVPLAYMRELRMGESTRLFCTSLDDIDDPDKLLPARRVCGIFFTFRARRFEIRKMRALRPPERGCAGCASVGRICYGRQVPARSRARYPIFVRRSKKFRRCEIILRISQPLRPWIVVRNRYRRTLRRIPRAAWPRARL